MAKFLFVKTKSIQNQKAPLSMLQYSESAMQIDNSTLLIKEKRTAISKGIQEEIFIFITYFDFLWVL